MATYSNWREDLIEVIDIPTTEKKAEKKVKEGKVKNTVVINPKLDEAVKELGGELLEVKEVDDKSDDKKNKEGTDEDPQIKSKEKRQQMIKRQVLLKKLQAVRAGGGADITAGYEPEGEMVESNKPEKDINKINEKKRKNALQIQKVIGEASAVLDANTKIKNKEQREKDKKELASLEKKAKLMQKYGSGYHPYLHKEEGEVNEGIMKMVKKVIRGNKPEKKAEKATDAGARAKRALARKVHAKYVSGSEDNVPDDIREGEDKAFNYVLAKLKAKHGDGVLTKGDKIKSPSEAQKKKNAAIMAKRAKQDGRDATEKASDGRYNDRSRSD